MPVLEGLAANDAWYFLTDRGGEPTKLIVRYGKHGQVTSATSTLGHVIRLLVVGAFVAGWVAQHRPEPRAGWILGGIILTVLVYIVVRDALAWCLASEEQRDAFKREIESIRAERIAHRAVSPMSRRNESLLLILGATAVFGLMFWAFVTHLPPLIVIPLAGWLYLVGRVLWSARSPDPRRKD